MGIRLGGGEMRLLVITGIRVRCVATLAEAFFLSFVRLYPHLMLALSPHLSSFDGTHPLWWPV